MINGGDGSSSGAAIGGAAGAVLALVAAAAVCWWAKKRREQRRAKVVPVGGNEPSGSTEGRYNVAASVRSAARGEPSGSSTEGRYNVAAPNASENEAGATAQQLAQQGGRAADVQILGASDARAAPKSALHAAMLQVADKLEGKFSTFRQGAELAEPSKFESKSLVFGSPEEAARGVEYYMNVDVKDVSKARLGGLEALKAEVERFGTNVDKECLDYVLHAEAGSSDIAFQGGLKRDCDEHGHLLPCRRRADGLGMRLADFVAHPSAAAAHLPEENVAALRFYTTAAYRSINNPLRDQARAQRGEVHTMPLTVVLIREALSKLRVVAAKSAQANTTVELFRGVRDMHVQDAFLEGGRGGTELAPMSVTSSLEVAMKYAASERALLLRVKTKNFMVRGPEISFLSAFPAEEEFLYPPLTYLQPTGETQTLQVDDATFTVIDVEPTMP